MAVGTITQKMQSFASSRAGQTMMHFILTCVGGTAGEVGTFPATVLGFKRAMRGARLEAIETVPAPASTSPTAGWGITVTDDGLVDLLGGAGAARSATVPQRVLPVVSTGIVGTAPTSGDTTVTISGNSVSAATITIHLWFSR